MERIVLGYDASPAAQSALEWVAHRIGDRAARVDVVTVTNMISSDYHRTETALHQAVAAIEALAPAAHVDSHSVDGSMPGALVEDARGADLTVIGVHQSHPVRSALTGWMPLRLAARASGPTVLVPEGFTPNEEPVTVGLDDDPSSDAALLAAAAEATAAGTQLRIVHSWTMPVPTIDGAVALLSSPIEVKEGHRKILRDAAARIAEAYPDLSIEALLVPSAPASALLEQAEQSSLLVLGTHHRGVVESGLLGSTAQDVLGQVRCPVLVVPRAHE